MRKTLLALVAIAAVLLGTTGCETTNADRAHVAWLVNNSRNQAGIPPLASNANLDLKADQHAQKMRNECRIYHSVLTEGVTIKWTKLGENVGRGSTMDQVHTAYMNSPGHRANIMDRAFNQIGTAAVYGTCNGYRTVFTVHVFARS